MTPISRPRRHSPSIAHDAQENGKHKRVRRVGAAEFGLIVLFLALVVNSIDRYILIVIQEQIKLDLGLSDKQLGALTGASFAILYTLAALPMGHFADRFVRKRLLATAIAFWSVMTALSGFAGNFFQLVLLRMGVAIGEAGCIPTSQSLLTDYFPPKRRAFAFGVFTQAAPIGMIIGFLGGGWLAGAIGWRNTLLVFGISGLLIVPLVLALKEPVRGAHDKFATSPQPVRQVPGILWRNMTVRTLLGAGSLHCMMLFTVQTWSGPFYARVHSVPLERLGILLAVLVGIAGCIGALIAILLARRLSRRDPRWYLWIMAAADLAAVPLILGQCLIGDFKISLAMGFGAVTMLSMFISLNSVVLLSVVAPTMRATTSAAQMLCLNIIGLGIGPFAVGALSDVLQQEGYAANSIRYAIAAVVVFAPLAAWLFVRSGEHLIKSPHAEALRG